ncbi:MAG TPA: PKD domain-containing protein [Candidatus Limnocylindrales bacterium]|nr:PKD domain-containing protein [Candidatus Limnocylindrales bacterium]
MPLEPIVVAFAVAGVVAVVFRFLPRDASGARRLPRRIDESVGMWAIRRALGRPTDVPDDPADWTDSPQPSPDEIAWRIGVPGAPAPTLPTKFIVSGPHEAGGEKAAAAIPASPAAPVPPPPRLSGPLPPGELVRIATEIVQRPAGRPARGPTPAGRRNALAFQRRAAALVALAVVAMSLTAVALSARRLDGGVLSATGAPTGASDGIDGSSGGFGAATPSAADGTGESADPGGSASGTGSPPATVDASAPAATAAPRAAATPRPATPRPATPRITPRPATPKPATPAPVTPTPVPPPPVAVLSCSPVGTFDVSCDASGSSGADVYTFDFGDGASESGGASSLNHTYGAAGTYGVTLTVVDALGRTDSTTVSVAVG